MRKDLKATKARSVTCHSGSHSVRPTCHLIQKRAPP